MIEKKKANQSSGQCKFVNKEKPLTISIAVFWDNLDETYVPSGAPLVERQN
jgi:hypothetical protein